MCTQLNRELVDGLTERLIDGLNGLMDGQTYGQIAWCLKIVCTQLNRELADGWTERLIDGLNGLMDGQMYGQWTNNGQTVSWRSNNSGNVNFSINGAMEIVYSERWEPRKGTYLSELTWPMLARWHRLWRCLSLLQPLIRRLQPQHHGTSKNLTPICNKKYPNNA